MNKELEILIQMQEKDDIIGKKEILTRTLPEKLSSMKSTLEEAEATKNATKEELDQNILSQKQNELNIKENHEKIAKYKNQLLTIKTNKEYKALNSEISTLDTKNSKIDDEIIILMEEEAKLKERLKVDTAAYEAAKKELQNNEDKLKKEIEVVKSEIDAVRQERNILAKELPINLVKRYGMLIKNKNRKAVAFSEGGACSGCGYKIRPQLEIELKAQNKVISCESCGRILLKKSEA